MIGRKPRTRTPTLLQAQTSYPVTVLSPLFCVRFCSPQLQYIHPSFPQKRDWWRVLAARLDILFLSLPHRCTDPLPPPSSFHPLFLSFSLFYTRSRLSISRAPWISSLLSWYSVVVDPYSFPFFFFCGFLGSLSCFLINYPPIPPHTHITTFSFFLFKCLSLFHRYHDSVRTHDETSSPFRFLDCELAWDTTTTPLWWGCQTGHSNCWTMHLQNSIRTTRAKWLTHLGPDS